MSAGQVEWTWLELLAGDVLAAMAAEVLAYRRDPAFVALLDKLLAKEKDATVRGKLERAQVVCSAGLRRAAPPEVSRCPGDLSRSPARRRRSGSSAP